MARDARSPAHDMNQGIALSALGQIDLRVSGEPARAVLAQPKRLALFAYLHLARPAGPQQRDVLLAMFWPESSQRRARQSLNQSLAFLRRALGPDAVVSRGRAAVEVPPGSVRSDVASFEARIDERRFADALALYRGELLPGLHFEGSGQFERWLDDAREGLRAKALATVGPLADRLEAEGRIDEAIEWSRRGRAIAPYEESLVLRLLQLLGRAGDGPGLSREYRDYVDRLDADLGAEPPPSVEVGYRRALDEAARSLPTTARPLEAAPELLVPAAPPTPDSGSPPPVQGATNRPRRGVERGRSLRRSLWVGTAVAALLALGFFTLPKRGPADPRLDPRRVLIAAFDTRDARTTHAWMAGVAVDWIGRELAGTGLVQVVVPGAASPPMRDRDRASVDPMAAAARAGAGLLVSGSVVSDQAPDGSARLEATILDVALRRIVAVVGPETLDPLAPAAGLAAFRDRVTAAVALAADPKLGDRAAIVGPLPDFRAYQAFVEGLDAMADDDGVAAADLFLAAASGDSTFVAPRIWAVRALIDANRIATADSLAGTLRHMRDEMTGWDRAMFDFYAAYLWGTWEDSYRAARRMVEIAPDPEWQYALAGAAQATNRPREALAILEQLRGEQSWIRDWPYRWRLLAFTLHDLGDFERELEVAGEFGPRDPEAAAQSAFGALAALGKLEELAARLDAHLSAVEDPSRQVTILAHVADELRAHGHAAAALPLVQRRLSLIESEGGAAGDDADRRIARAQALLDLGDADGAYAALTDAPQASSDPEDLLNVYRAQAAAHAGRAAEVRAFLVEHASLPSDKGARDFVRARILAALGDRAGATESLTRAFSLGFGHYPWLHTLPEFVALRAYEPFRALMRPRG